MASYVVDTSVLIQSLIEQEFSEQADALIRRVAEGDKLYVPEFCLLECANVIWKQVQKKNITSEIAVDVVQDLQDIPVEIVLVKNHLPEALKIGIEHNLAIYDSLYIALAQNLNFPLITLDRKQSSVAESFGIQLLDLQTISLKNNS